MRVRTFSTSSSRNLPERRGVIVFFDCDGGHRKQIGSILSVREEGVAILKILHREAVFLPAGERPPISTLARADEMDLTAGIDRARLNHGGEEQVLTYARPVDRRAVQIPHALQMARTI